MEPETAGHPVRRVLGEGASGERSEYVARTHTCPVGELIPCEGLAGPESQEHALEGRRRQSGARHGASFTVCMDGIAPRGALPEEGLEGYLALSARQRR